MEPFTLSTSTGNQQVDEILRGTIGILETVFPERIRAYYLHGSFANETGISTSDIDLFLIPKGAFTPEERQKMQRIMHFSAFLSPFMVEMMAIDEHILLQHGHFRIKHASRLLWGTEIREQVPEQTLDDYLRLYASFPFLYISSMLRTTETVTLPLAYPQSTSEFYGYDQQQLPPGNTEQHNIKKLVTSCCWIATILIAWNCGKTVPGKRESVSMYEEFVHDEWGPFLAEMYELGNQRWHYLVPSDTAERQQLRDLCARTLAFENHYLHRYQRYLQTELEKDEASNLSATRQLSKILFLK